MTKKKSSYICGSVLIGIALLILASIVYAYFSGTLQKQHTDQEVPALYQITKPDSVTIVRFFETITAEYTSQRFTLVKNADEWYLKENPDIPLMQSAAKQIVDELASPTCIRIFTKEEYDQILTSSYFSTASNRIGATVAITSKDQHFMVTFLKPVPDGSGWYVIADLNNQKVAGILPAHAYALCCFSPDTLQDTPRFPIPPAGTDVTLQITHNVAVSDTYFDKDTDDMLQRLHDLQYARIIIGDTAKLTAPENVITTMRIISSKENPATEITITKYKPQQDFETGENYDIYTISTDSFVYRILPVYSPF